MTLTYEIPKISDLNPSSPDYMSRLEAGLRKLEVIADIFNHERQEARILFPRRFNEILQKGGIEARIGEGRITDFVEQLRSGTAISLDGVIVLYQGASTEGDYKKKIQCVRILQGTKRDYNRFKLEEEWKLDDQTKEIEKAYTDFKKGLHSFTTIKVMSANHAYEKAVYYFATGDGIVVRLYIESPRAILDYVKDPKDLPEPKAQKKSIRMDGSFFDEQSNLDKLREEAEKLKVRAYVVKSPSTYFGVDDLIEHAVIDVELPFVIDRKIRDLEGKPTRAERQLEYLVTDMGNLARDSTDNTRSKRPGKWRERFRSIIDSL